MCTSYPRAGGELERSESESPNAIDATTSKVRVVLLLELQFHYNILEVPDSLVTRPGQATLRRNGLMTLPLLKDISAYHSDLSVPSSLESICVLLQACCRSHSRELEDDGADSPHANLPRLA